MLLPPLVEGSGYAEDWCVRGDGTSATGLERGEGEDSAIVRLWSTSSGACRPGVVSQSKRWWSCVGEVCSYVKVVILQVLSQRVSMLMMSVGVSQSMPTQSRCTKERKVLVRQSLTMRYRACKHCRSRRDFRPTRSIHPRS